MSELDPNLTFESFVVGPANRLASAAARRAADAPGTSYNPLFLYSASGLGKTHILTAIAHHTLRGDPGRRLEYMALEKYLERLEGALEEGHEGAIAFEDLDILLLDDVQFLTGQPQAQEMLLRTLDHLSAARRQVVLASDRPPSDIDGLDARLLSRFSGGLIVDIGNPEYETRVAIIRRKAEERGQTLEPGVAEALARHPFRNVRELGGGLNKVLATQELEERRVTAEEMPALLGIAAESEPAADSEFDSFLDDLVSSLEEIVEEREEPWRRAVHEALDDARREGYSVVRLEPFLRGPEPPGWEEALAAFLRDVDRLREIEAELDDLRNPWPEAAAGVLKDPDRVKEAESLLASVRERQRPFPRLARGQVLSDLEDYPRIAIRAAEQLVGRDRPQYNPLFVTSRDRELGRTLLGAAGRAFQVAHPESRMAVTSVAEFASDFIRALGEGVAGAWRERWWTLDLLLVHAVEALDETERAQEEFFHLFEALKRRGARMMFVSDRSPSEIGGIDDRLRSRFEGGLVLELSSGTPGMDLVMEERHLSITDAAFLDDLSMPSVPGATGVFVLDEPAAPPAGRPTRSAPPAPPATPPARRETGGPAPAPAATGSPGGSAPTRGSATAPAPASAPVRAPVTTSAPASAPGAVPRPDEAWYPSRERAVVYWPQMADLLIEELD